MKIILLTISTFIGVRIGTSKIRSTLDYLMTVPTGDLCYYETPTTLEYVMSSAIIGGLVGFVIGLLLVL